MTEYKGKSGIIIPQEYSKGMSNGSVPILFLEFGNTNQGLGKPSSWLARSLSEEYNLDLAREIIWQYLESDLEEELLRVFFMSNPPVFGDRPKPWVTDEVQELVRREISEWKSFQFDDDREP